jgi:hypothetical protein
LHTAIRACLRLARHHRRHLFSEFIKVIYLAFQTAI